MSFLPFNFFDFLRHSAYLLTDESRAYLLYLEFPLIGTVELLKLLTKDYRSVEKEAFFTFGNSSVLILTPNYKNFLKHTRKTEIYNRFLKGKLIRATLNLKRFKHSPGNLLRMFYDKVKERKRYPYIPNIEGYYKIADLISREASEISTDLPDENPFFSVETLEMITGSKIAFIAEENRSYLKIRRRSKTKLIKLTTNKKPAVKIDSITIEDAQKILQSHFISPNINEEILEILYYRSMKSFSKLLQLLYILDSKNFFEWDESSGWVLKKAPKFPDEASYPKKSQKLFESMSKEEKLITYIILSSAQPLDKTDLLKLFPKTKSQTVEGVIEYLTKNKILKVIRNKIHSLHPVIEFTPTLNLSEQEVKKIHNNYAQLLRTKKMNGFSIASWEIARHFELAGNYKNAFNYYYEAIHEEVKKMQFEKAYQHAKKAKSLAQTKKQKSSIEETIINLYIQMGEYHQALEFINELKKEKNVCKQLRKTEIKLLAELGETKKALRVLKEFLSMQKRQDKDLTLVKLKIDYNSDDLEFNTKLFIKKLKSKNSTQNGRVKILEVIGDCEFYNNRIKKAIEYYLRALKASKKMEDSMLLKLKLAEMLFLNFRFREALSHLENVLWSLSEVKNKHVKETLLEKICKIYLFLFPPSCSENFIKYSIEDILNTTPKTDYPFNFYISLSLIQSGSVKEGCSLSKQELDIQKQKGNVFRANLMSLTLVHYLLKYNQLEKVKEFLKNVQTKSEYIFTRKKLLEKLVIMVQDNCNTINKEEIKMLAEMNALNALAFFDVTQNLKDAEIQNIRNSLLGKYNDLKDALLEVDLWRYYPN